MYDKVLIVCTITLLRTFFPLFTRMSSCITQLLILSCTAYLVEAKCWTSDQKPEVAVKNSSHISVSWNNSFEGCENKRVESALVKVNGDTKFVNFSEGTANVKASPCLTHRIREAISKSKIYEMGEIHIIQPTFNS